MAKLNIDIKISMDSLIKKAKYYQIKKTPKGKRYIKNQIKGFLQSRLSKTKIKKRYEVK